MKAHDSYLTALLKLSDAVFNIPVYQRNYDWNTENCQQLFSDLETIALTQKDHFIGSIVYISIGTATEPYYNIIDGQQRITSVMLFLRALHDSTDDKKFQKQVRHGFLVNIGLDDEPKMKLKQVESDSAVYEKLVLQDEFKESDYTEQEKKSNVYRNYLFFKEQIEQSNVSLQDLYNAIFRLEIIDVCLTSEDPQEVFESMNSTGKSLTNTDLLRNYLLMDLTHSKQEQLYKKYWSQIEKNVGAGMMEQYMVHYLIMKRKSDSINIHRRSSKVNKNTLYECYKLYIPPENKKGDGTEELLQDMYRYSNVYRKIVNNDNKSHIDRSLRELIFELNAEQTAIFLMYLLEKQGEEGISDDEMEAAIQACISYVFRVRVFKGSVSNQFFALAIQYFDRGDVSVPFVERVWEALTSGQGSYRFPKDREFQNAFETKDMYLEFKPQMIRYILYKYERKQTKDYVDPTDTTIEHILPQNAEKWKSYLSEIHDDKFAEYVHKIGNLTLTKMNSEASNEVFEEKKKVYARSGYYITRELTKIANWNSIEIKKRTNKMAEEAIGLWPLPQKYNQDVSSSSWQIMDDQIELVFNQLCETIKEYDPSIYEEPKKQYINFMRERKNILSVIPCEFFLWIVINEKINNLTPNDDLEDISNKGHWGVGDTRMKISDDEGIWQLLSYVDQIVNPQN